MRKREILIITFSSVIVMCFILVGIFVINSIKSQKNIQTQMTVINSSTVYTGGTEEKGFAISPKNGTDFIGFFSDAYNQNAKIITWSGDWIELEKPNSAAQTLYDLSSRYAYQPLPIVQFFSQNSGELIRELSDKNINTYKNIAINYVKKNKLKYFGIGIEVNILFEKDKVNFDKFKKMYFELYDEIKQVSSSTKVFTIFQLEHMKGLQGGLFGGKNDATKSQWDLIDLFKEKNDLSVFTTYPCIIYKNPKDIPQDYYSEVLKYTDKQIAYTEIGWFSNSTIAGYTSDETEQADFISYFLEQQKSIKPVFMIWSFLYDPTTNSPIFRTMGLIDSSNKPKSGLGLWKSKT